MIQGDIKFNKAGTAYIEVDSNVIAKECRKCGEMKVLGEYHAEKRGFAGKRCTCAECNKERRKVHYAKNREREIAHKRKYVEENREVIREARRNRYKEHRVDEINKTLQWKHDNKELVAMQRANRKARVASLPSDLTHEQLNYTLSHFKGRCALTGEDCEIHLDHFIPLCTGHGGTTFGNIIPIRADLNISKNGSNPFEWFKMNKERFNLSQRRFDGVVTYLARINNMSIADYRDYVYECFNNQGKASSM